MLYLSNFTHKGTSSLNVDSQQGVALITVLLLVVSITIVAGSMLASQQISIRKTNLLFNQDDFSNQIISAEHLAVEIIKADGELNESDSSQDIWAESIPPYINDHGHVTELTINDASAKFNINNIFHDGDVDEQALASLERLLVSLGIDVSLARAILDWQDPGSDVYLDGGDESVVYASSANTPQGSKVSNQPFISVEQLTELPDVTSETISTLRPYITAVPYWLPININTASEQVLKAITNDSPNVANVLSTRENTPYESIDEVDGLNLFEGIEEDDRKKAKMLLDVKSKAFKTIVKVSASAFGGVKSDKVKYATFYIAKGDMTTNSNNQNITDEVNTNSQKDVQVFSKRIWAFNPDF